MTKSLFFVDRRVSDYRKLLVGLPEGSEIHLLDPDRDGLNQMADFLSGRNGFDSIQIISHGCSGALYLGSTVLNSNNLATYQDALGRIGQALSETGDILLYGCNVAQGDTGRDFITHFADITGADVAASSDLTGSEALGGDWILDTTNGAIETVSISLPDYQGLLGLTVIPMQLSFLPTYSSGESPNNFACAALRADGSVVTWGNSATGGDSSSAASALDGNIAVTQVFSSSNSFAALRADGSVVTWGREGGNSSSVAAAINGDIDVIQVFSNSGAFAALRVDGSVVTWGEAGYGGDSSSVATELDGDIDVIQVCSIPSSSFAALRADGSVVTWGGYSAIGGDSSSVASAIDGNIDVTQVFSNQAAYAALRADGSVITWGQGDFGGNSSSVAAALEGDIIDVTRVFSTGSAFAALRADGSVVTWGGDGGNSSSVAVAINGDIDVTLVSSSLAAFAALRADGSVITWGHGNYGGDSTDVAAALNGTIDVTRVFSGGSAFAALRADGSVVTWGNASYGGDSGSVAVKLDGTVDVTDVFTNGSAFAALRADGSVVTWGENGNGGNSIDVAAALDGTIDVTRVFKAGSAFAALRVDGSVVTWGNASYGGDSSSVASQLTNVVSMADPTTNDVYVVEGTDAVSPTAYNFSPADGADGVDVDSNIVVTLSEAIQRGTGNIILKTDNEIPVASYDVASSPNITFYANALSINPSTDLTSSSSYILEIPAGAIVDMTGNSYAGTTNYNFTAADIIAPAAPTINTVATDNIINADETASVITGSNEAGATVALSIGGNTRTATISGSSWSYTLVATDITAMGQGAETLSATQTDAAGNISSARTRSITVDTSAPSAPTIIAVATDDIINTSEQSSTITGTNEAGATVALSIGGNSRVAMVNGATWSYTLVAADLAAMGQGAETLSATQTDAAGNTSSAGSRSIMVDTTAPIAPKLVTNAAFNFLIDPQVTMQTSMGTVVLELHPEQAPITVANLLAYVDSGFYDNTLFHRVIPNFMAQGGGFTTGLVYKTPTYNPIVLESNNGLSNLRGTIAMARTSVANSATSQFFVNQVDNTYLNYSSASSPGYAVFGQVVSGLAVIDSIVQVPTKTVSPYANVPVTEVTITSLQQTLAGSSITNTATLTVSDLENGAQWSYSLDDGATWTEGLGTSFTVPVGSYAAGAIEIRQSDAAGNLSGSGTLSCSLVVETTAPTVTGYSPADEATGVTIDGNIVVTFSETIQRGSGNILLNTVAGVIVATYNAASSSNLAITGNTLTINPTADLLPASGYKVEFAAGAIKDLAGNSYAGTNTYNFTTAAYSTYPGTPGSDTFSAGVNNDLMNGGAGLDNAIFAGNRQGYNITPTGSGCTLSGAGWGTDTLTSIERLHFADVNLAWDIDGSAGQVYRLYQAAFDRTPDLGGLGGWIGGMDGGMTLLQVAAAFVGSAEFQSLYGANPSNEQFITQLYLNVLNRAPDEGGFGYWVDQLASSLQSRAEVLVFFSESGENQAAVLPAIAGGILYASAEQAAGLARGQNFEGSTLVDILIGTVGNDSFFGGGGDDSFDGGVGIDSAIYEGSRTGHTITRTSGGLTVSGSSDGTDTLVNVERLKFTDSALAFDIDGNAGQTYRLYQAAFARTPDTAGLSDWIRGMDTGMTLQNVATGFIGSGEFQGLYGASPTNTEFINLLYSNVLHRAADQAGYDYWSDQIEHGMSREQVLVGFSESQENQLALLGVIQDGIDYIPA